MVQLRPGVTSTSPSPPSSDGRIWGRGALTCAAMGAAAAVLIRLDFTRSFWAAAKAVSGRGLGWATFLATTGGTAGCGAAAAGAAGLGATGAAAKGVAGLGAGLPSA